VNEVVCVRGKKRDRDGLILKSDWWGENFKVEIQGHRHRPNNARCAFRWNVLLLEGRHTTHFSYIGVGL